MTDNSNEASPGCATRARGLVSYLVFLTCSVPLLGLGLLGGMGFIELLQFLVVLVVLGPVVLWVLVKPVCALGRRLARRFGAHRVFWALFATTPLLAALITPMWLLWDQDAAAGITLAVVVLLLPMTATYAALARDGLRPSRAGKVLAAGALLALDLEDAPVLSDGAAARQAGRRHERDRRVLATILVQGGVQGRTIHRERTPKLWSTIVVTVAVVGIALMFATSDPEDYGVALFLSALFLLMFALPLLISPFLKFLNNRIQLTDLTLRVGRHVVGLDRLLPETAAQEPHVRPLARLDETVQLGGKTGGSTPMGYTPVSVRTRAGDLLSMDSRRPEELIRALHSLGAPRGHGPTGRQGPWGHLRRHPGGP